MLHAKTCHGDCGTWRDGRSVVWNFCRMTDGHLANVVRHLEANEDRLSKDDQRNLVCAVAEQMYRQEKRAI